MPAASSHARRRRLSAGIEAAVDGIRHAVTGPRPLSWGTRGAGGPGRAAREDRAGVVAVTVAPEVGTAAGAWLSGAGAVRHAARSSAPRTRAMSSSAWNGLAR